MVFFVFIQIFIEHSASKHGDPDQTPHSVMSGLGLHCLPLSYKKYARLIIYGFIFLNVFVGST